MAAKEEQGKLRVVEFYSGIGGMHYALKGNALYEFITTII